MAKLYVMTGNDKHIPNKYRWQTCSKHNGKYLKSKTSHPTICGICHPFKGKVKFVENEQWHT